MTELITRYRPMMVPGLCGAAEAPVEEAEKQRLGT